jgi:hypothetical protein
MMMKLSAAVLTSVFWSSQAAPVWTPSDIQQRRLAFHTGMTTTDKTSADCIVGGYDDQHPTQIYVGGPCSELKDAGPSTKFRYVVMKTIDIDIHGKNAATGKMSTVGLQSFGDGTVHTKDEPSHMEVGVSGAFKTGDPGFANAALFASTTSYLSKAEFNYTNNTFVTGRNGDEYQEITMCVTPCCDAVTNTGCACAGSTCPTKGLSASIGDYKYSIMSAFYNIEGATAGTSGNGWEGMVAKYGVDTPGGKALSGNLRVYQAIDFANMAADTLTVTGGGASTTYATMVECNLTSETLCTEYAVESIALAASDWEGLVYNFPKFYNRGSWTTSAAGATTTTIAESKKVAIHCVKVDAASLKAITGMSDAAAAKAKVVLLRYAFDISGGSATAKGGNYMVYDPTVNTKTRADAKAAAGAAAATTAGAAATTGGAATTAGGAAATTGGAPVTAGASSTAVPATVVLGASALAAVMSI